jgi:hypothetical protein
MRTKSTLPTLGPIRGERIEGFLRNNLPIQWFEELKIPIILQDKSI